MRGSEASGVVRGLAPAFTENEEDCCAAQWAQGPSPQPMCQLPSSASSLVAAAPTLRTASSICGVGLAA